MSKRTETKRILAVMSEFGYWGIELVGPMRKLEAAGYKFDFVSPKGKRSPVLPPSTDTTYIDPPLGVRSHAGPECDDEPVKNVPRASLLFAPELLARIGSLLRNPPLGAGIGIGNL